jgi:hypothetical protein
MKNGQKLNLGDAHALQGNIQEVQASKLGDALEAPLLHWQKSGHLSKHYIFITSCTMHFLGASVFLLAVFFCFVCCNKWLDHIMFVLERAMLHSSLPRTL